MKLGLILNQPNPASGNKQADLPERKNPLLGTKLDFTNTRILHGSGLTKKLGEQAAKQQVKMQAETHSVNEAEIAEIKRRQEEGVQSIADKQLITLDDSQNLALDGSVQNQFCIIIGAAGTGKSTLEQFIADKLVEKLENPIIRFAAPTGRAAQQQKRNLRPEYRSQVSTIHALLEFKPVFYDVYDEKTGEVTSKFKFEPTRNASNPLEANVLMLDEQGMNSIDLWNMIIDACRPGTRIILFGDIQQLPPVQGRSILGFAMQKYPTYELAKSHRTKENAIINGAWDILNGICPKPEHGKVVMQKIEDDPLKAFQQVIGIVHQLSELKVYEPFRDAVITAQNGWDDSANYELGQIHINERLVTIFNPSKRDEAGTVTNPRTMIKVGKFGTRAFAVGDKVMVTENDLEAGLTNGMTGVIVEIKANAKYKGQEVMDLATIQLLNANAKSLDLDMFQHDVAKSVAPKNEEELAEEKKQKEMQASHIVTVLFDGVESPQTFANTGAVASLMHAYAFTCHKAQGGEYPVVIIVLHSCMKISLSREWLYTAWTRAQSRIVLLYNDRGMKHALSRQHIVGNTLQAKAQKFIDLNDRALKGDETIKLPILPENKTSDQLKSGFKETFKTYKELEAAEVGGAKDCTVKALTLLAGISYNDAYLAYQKAGRPAGRGAKFEVTQQVYPSLGLTLDPIWKLSLGGTGFSLLTIGDRYPIGKYLVRTSQHALALIDGKVEDWTEDRKIPVLEVYKVLGGVK